MATTNNDNIPRYKRALVIGNNNYSRPESQLIHCVNDANDLSQLLKKINFNVTTHHNLTNADMTKAIKTFKESIVNGDLILFYFSGHGYQVNGRNYLMPVDDDEIATDEDVEDRAFDAEKELDRLARKSPSCVTIFILDCCRTYWTKEAPRKRGIHYFVSSCKKPESFFIR